MSWIEAPVALPVYNDINPCMYCPEAARIESSDSGSNLIAFAVDASVINRGSSNNIGRPHLLGCGREAKVEQEKKKKEGAERGKNGKHVKRTMSTVNESE
jgi:hypothetical protein